MNHDMKTKTGGKHLCAEKFSPCFENFATVKINKARRNNLNGKYVTNYKSEFRQAEAGM
jgi:hypothetical protein